MKTRVCGFPYQKRIRSFGFHTIRKARPKLPKRPTLLVDILTPEQRRPPHFAPPLVIQGMTPEQITQALFIKLGR